MANLDCGVCNDVAVVLIEGPVYSGTETLARELSALLKKLNQPIENITISQKFYPSGKSPEIVEKAILDNHLTMHQRYDKRFTDWNGFGEAVLKGCKTKRLPYVVIVTGTLLLQSSCLRDMLHENKCCWFYGLDVVVPAVIEKIKEGSIPSIDAIDNMSKDEYRHVAVPTYRNYQKLKETQDALRTAGSKVSHLPWVLGLNNEELLDQVQTIVNTLSEAGCLNRSRRFMEASINRDLSAEDRLGLEVSSNARKNRSHAETVAKLDSDKRRSSYTFDRTAVAPVVRQEVDIDEHELLQWWFPISAVREGLLFEDRMKLEDLLQQIKAPGSGMSIAQKQKLVAKYFAEETHWLRGPLHWPNTFRPLTNTNSHLLREPIMQAEIYRHRWS